MAAEWDAAAAASDAWKAADKTFRDTRDDVQAAHDSVEAARKDIAEAEAILAHSPGDPAALAAATDAQAALADAEVSAASAAADAAHTPAEVRTHLADALAQDLGRPKGDRRLWPTVDGQALAALIDDGEVPQEGLTDTLRRDIIEALRTPGGYDDVAGDIAPVVAGQVFGLTLQVVLADGSLYEVGAPDGRRITVARVPREARGYDHWIAGVPIGAVSSRIGVRAGRGDVASGGARAGLTASAPGHPARPRRASSRESAAAPRAFFDAPRPAATEDDRPAQDTKAVVR